MPPTTTPEISTAARPSDAAAIIDAVVQMQEVDEIDLPESDEKDVILAVPRGKELVSVKKYLDEYRTKPERHKGTAKLHASASFIAHVNRFKDEGSAIFVDSEGDDPSMTAVFDYSEQGDGGQRFGQHRARYEFPISEEWAAWTAAAENGPMSLETFAEFLEDRILDVVPVTGVLPKTAELASALGFRLGGPQRLLELSQGLKVKVVTTGAQAVSLPTGEARLTFAESHSDENGAPLNIPQGFVIAIPVFRNGDLFQLPVKLRYRINSGRITWEFVIQRVDKTWDTAVGEVAKAAQEATSLPLFFGTPES